MNPADVEGYEEIPVIKYTSDLFEASITSKDGRKESSYKE